MLALNSASVVEVVPAPSVTASGAPIVAAGVAAEGSGSLVLSWGPVVSTLGSPIPKVVSTSGVSSSQSSAPLSGTRTANIPAVVGMPVSVGCSAAARDVPCPDEREVRRGRWKASCSVHPGEKAGAFSTGAMSSCRRAFGSEPAVAVRRERGSTVEYVRPERVVNP